MEEIVTQEMEQAFYVQFHGILRRRNNLKNKDLIEGLGMVLCLIKEKIEKCKSICDKEAEKLESTKHLGEQYLLIMKS